MKKISLLLTLVLLVTLLISVGTAVASDNRNFRTHLSGDEEVPPVQTNAQGQVKFQLNKAGDELSYKLIVANIENVFAAHIHCAPAGLNGPIGVTLFGPVAPGGGRVNGILAQGDITAPDAGNACGWTDLDAVVAAMQSGNAYVNVHTNPGVPSGEIRGQIH
jgi:hypothetical protein